MRSRSALVRMKGAATYRYGVDELADAIEVIAEARADGQRTKRRWGLSPAEMESRQMQKEAALFYYLVYGQNAVLKDEQLKRLADPQEVNGNLFISAAHPKLTASAPLTSAA